MRPRILICGALPPPYNGPSLTYDALMSSSFSGAFQIDFVSMVFYRRIDEVGELSLRKAWLAVEYMLRLSWLALVRRPDYALITASFGRWSRFKVVLLTTLFRAAGVAVVQYAHDDSFRVEYEKGGRLQRWCLRRYARVSLAWISLGYLLREAFPAACRPRHHFVVESGIRVSVPAEEARRALAERARSPFRVLYLGNLIEGKGFFDVIRAAPMVLREAPDTEFLMAGTYDRSGLAVRREVEAYIRAEGLGEAVRFAGVVTGDAKTRLLLSSNVLVFPTRYEIETFGLVNLEAMEAGLPVITTRRGAIPEIIEEGVNGLLVPEGDPAAIARCVLQLHDDPVLCRAMGERNIEKFHRMYTAEMYGRRMTSVFTELSGSSGAAPSGTRAGA